uniref:Uncharacterized protein n=1 Tax=Pseudomonas syringae pv. cerasicola TaxID=264451 RepID=A0A330JWQ3_PSESX|nr:hypothetical protein PSCFBP6110_P100038 [Pseudomonas syringae pv. cerasicola]
MRSHPADVASAPPTYKPRPLKKGSCRIRKKSYYKGIPIEHKPNSFCLTPLHVPDRRKEGEGLRYYKRSS